VTYYGALYQGGVAPGKVREAIEKVGLWDYRDLRLSKCSKGMKQKAGIAACLLRDVDLLFLDEPTRGLDPLMVRDFRNLLVEMNRRGTTIVLNSHILSEIEMICTRAAVMNRGRVLAQDSLKALMKYDTDSYTIDLEPAEPLPEFMTEVERTFSSVRAVIPSSKAGDFFAFASERGLKVYGCSHRHQTLEEAFFSILKEAEG
jgi:ABC-2 type transport system ATP-binding protein